MSFKVSINTATFATATSVIYFKPNPKTSLNSNLTLIITLVAVLNGYRSFYIFQQTIYSALLPRNWLLKRRPQKW